MPSLTVLPGVGIPPPGLIERFVGPMRAVAFTWRDVARVVPVEITSWWRDPYRNAATAGKSYSQHLVGTAMDGRSRGLTRAQLLPLVMRAAERYGVAVPVTPSDTSGTSVHVQGLPVGFVQQLLMREPALVEQTYAFVGPPRPIA